MVERCVRDAEVASSNLVASMIPAYWSSGQDAALSRRKPGFDSRIGHERKKHCLMMDGAFFCAPGGGGRKGKGDFWPCGQKSRSPCCRNELPGGNAGSGTGVQGNEITFIKNKNYKFGQLKRLPIFCVRLAAHVSNGCKSLIRPSSGKDIAKTKGVLFIATTMINARGI